MREVGFWVLEKLAGHFKELLHMFDIMVIDVCNSHQMSILIPVDQVLEGDLVYQDQRIVRVAITDCMICSLTFI